MGRKGMEFRWSRERYGVEGSSGSGTVVDRFRLQKSPGQQKSKHIDSDYSRTRMKRDRQADPRY